MIRLLQTLRAGASSASGLPLVVAVLTAGAGPLSAQSIPGIVVMAPQGGPTQAPPPSGFPPGVTPGGPAMMPPPGPPGLPPMAAPMPAPAGPGPAAAVKPKAKPKHKPAAVANAEPSPAGAAGGGGGSGKTTIAILVNGDPITNYEVDQRAKLLAMQIDVREKVQETLKRLAKSDSVNARWKEIVEETIKANQGKTREQIMAIIQERQKAYSMSLQKQAIDSAKATAVPQMRQKAEQELIEELVKLQEAKKQGVSADEARVDAIVKDIASRNKLTPAQFIEHFRGLGIDFSTFKARFRAQQAWAEAIRKRFGHMVVTNNRDIDELLKKDGPDADLLELELQRIVISVPPKIDQKAMAERLAAAESIHQSFTDCASTGKLASKAADARFESMGIRKAENFPEPTRTMLLNAKYNEMLPPTVTTGGIEVIAVCGRKVVKASEEKRNQKANEIRQEEFERISKKHLRDVMADAVIEKR